jgi:hypothetical protein
MPPTLFRRVGARSVLHFLLPKICVVTVAELLAGFGSKLGELATAVFVIDVLFVDPEIFTVMVTVAVAPLAMFPKLQVTVPTWPRRLEPYRTPHLRSSTQTSTAQELDHPT